MPFLGYLYASKGNPFNPSAAWNILLTSQAVDSTQLASAGPKGNGRGSPLVLRAAIDFTAKSGSSKNGSLSGGPYGYSSRHYV